MIMQPSDAAPVHQQTWPDLADLSGSQRCGHAAKRSAGVCWKLNPTTLATCSCPPARPIDKHRPFPEPTATPMERTNTRPCGTTPPSSCSLERRVVRVLFIPGRELGPGITRCCTRPAEGGRGAGGLGGTEGLTDRSLTALRLVILTGFLDSL